ncbi:DNA repair protein RadA [Gryllotalpicola protaetiae]|uniref:DNA repair protein RadA n=1 Tax=Gryllotalpicola protaetiae TaxID=2419771 RepID=A0A387BXI3_9MICO|nr:DNA repair protein RadA [Gryllotalpicola protaetiae]AYG03061.1 DNA repair protein RadA [Gryllotalpicola protaetiae]
MPKTATNFACTECGWSTSKWAGRCAECGEWNTVIEAAAPTGILRALNPVAIGGDRRARPINEIETDAASHWPSGIVEFDRVLGGGIVPGAAILLSGEPGVGKSTLLLEVASKAAAAYDRVLYVSAEESASQVRLRAERTGALHDNLYLAAETELGAIVGQIDAVKPGLVIVDSVQTVSSENVGGLAGGPARVREVAVTLIRVAKERNVPVLLVGHVTKDGNVAGPRLLEHLVDVVCQFEGDRQTPLRFVRALKNRFGPTDEVGCFEMTADGIAEVPDPSGLFLSRSVIPVSGTCVTIAMEGRRPLPVEVQALVVPTEASNPRRITSGVDPARVAMLIAVLDRRGGLEALRKSDVYVSTVGGVRVTEPAADLAIALAIASATTGGTVANETAAFGEISLAGDIRPAPAGKQRTSEAGRLGFTTLIDADALHVSVAIPKGVKAPAA